MSLWFKKSVHFKYFTLIFALRDIFIWCQQYQHFLASAVSTLCLKSLCWCNTLRAPLQHCLCQDYVTIMGSENGVSCNEKVTRDFWSGGTFWFCNKWTPGTLFYLDKGSEKSWIKFHHFTSNCYWWCLHTCLLMCSFLSYLSSQYVQIRWSTVWYANTCVSKRHFF